MTTCAVIPAAGRGTRLGSGQPKILTPVAGDDTIWSILHAKLAPLVDHVHVVLSPEGAEIFPPLPVNVSSSVQPAPTGMGDAIFQAADVWSGYDAVLVVWGDQVFVSRDTLARAIAALEIPDRHVVLPLTRMTAPYVEYVFDGGGLSRVLQTREGEATALDGRSDVGTFLLGTAGLEAVWADYLLHVPPGGRTGEINFLPFLPFLSSRGWHVTPLEVADATEARGVNTQDDLAFFQSLYKKRP